MGASIKSITTGGLRAVYKATRALFLTVTACLCALFIAVFVLWDADFFEVRDKWENFKVAMLGEWQPKSRLVDGVDEINLFRRENVPGFGTIVTGASFALTNGDMEAQASSQWCYVSYGSGVTTRRVDLGTQDGINATTFSDFQSIPQDVLTELGVTASRLADLARANCRFGSFDATDPS